MHARRSKSLAALSALICLCGVSIAFAAPPQARVASGLLLGQRTDAVNVFKSIPYAAPPTGELRWKPPEPARRWKGVRAADTFGPACPQPTNVSGAPNLGGYAGPTDENCLTLNVWAPRAARRAPVMVWIHGGAHRFGAGSMPLYNGTAFARDGVVLVSFNYRLAGLGYFAHPALTEEAGPRRPLGDFGLMDQIAVLRWVRDNIGAFGGDPSNVTVFGESSSAIDVQALMATRAARDLFQKAIVESGGSWVTPVRLREREADGVKLASRAGLSGPQATATALRALPATAFLDPSFSFDFEPFIDGRLITETSTQAFARRRASRKPMIIGFNSFEGAIAPGFAALGDLPRRLGALYPDNGQGDAALRALYGDRFFGAPSRWVAAQAAPRAKTYLYRFSYVPEHDRRRLPGAPHGSEIAFVFDSWDRLGGAVLDQLAGSASGPTPQDRDMTALIHGCWVAFAKTGAPDCPPAPAWAAYSTATDQLMEFDVQSALRGGVAKARFDALERAVLPTLVAAEPP
jgi:para-nitrobenzyl esterase